jgi:hypothetical protein
MLDGDCSEEMMRKRSLALVLIAFGGVMGFARTPKSAVQKPNQDVKGPDSAHSVTQSAALPSGGPVATEPNLRIAFIGDVGNGPNQRAVLNLIKSEGAQAVLHQGDFDYHGDPTGFWSSIDNILGANFPYFVSVGNHDVDNWPTTA